MYHFRLLRILNIESDDLNGLQILNIHIVNIESRYVDENNNLI